MAGDVDMTLSTLCGGDLEAEFQACIPALMSQLKPKKKASIAITIELQRVENTSTMVQAAYSLTPKFPATKKSSLCRVTGDNKLKTEAPVEKPKVVGLFANNNQGGNE